MKIRRVVAVLAGAGLLGTSVALARVDNLVESAGAFLLLWTAASACYGAGLWALWPARSRATLGFILAVAVACRLVLLPTPPTLSTDAYRYVWDARVAAAGVSPYAYPASAPEVAALREQTIYPRLNHVSWRTIYPPGAQAVFRAVYALVPDSVLAMKVVLGLAEAGALALGLLLLAQLGVPATRIAIWAWSPLVLVEVWSSAHLDALVLPLIIAATLAAVRERHGLAAVCLAVATLVKLYPALLVMLLVRRVPALGLFAAIVVAGYLPLASLGLDGLGSLPRYLGEEHFNAGLIRTVVDHPVPILVGTALWLVLVARQADQPLAARAVALTGGAAVLGPNVFPWYLLWLVPFLAVAPSLPWLAFSATVGLAYTFFLSTPWSIPVWARLLEFAPLAALIPGAVTMIRQGALAAVAARKDLTAL